MDGLHTNKPSLCSGSCDDFNANKQVWSTFETFLKHFWNTFETLLKHFWNNGETLIKHWEKSERIQVVNESENCSWQVVKQIQVVKESEISR